MNYICFDYLDGLLAYLRACELGHSKLGKLGDRELYKKIAMASGERGPMYSLPVADEHRSAVEQEFLYGGVFVSDMTMNPGQLEDVNALLKRLPLRVGAQPPAHIQALVVVARVKPTDGRQAVSKAHARLHAAWRVIPRQTFGQSTFYLFSSPADASTWVAVHVEGVEPWFDPVQWLEQYATEGLQLFVPSTECETMRFYVQWGFAYPRPRDFYLLYDEDQDQEALLLCSSAGELPRGAVSGGTTRDSWHQSKWQVLTNAEGSFAGATLQLSNELVPMVENLMAEALPEEARVELPLAIGDTRVTVGSLAQLDQRISSMERELEDLHTRRNRIKMSFHREYVPIHIFRNDKAGELPRDLERFLSRPLGELALFQYLRATLFGEDVHCVIGSVPVARGAALSVPCSATYLQDGRWLEWGLPLFVRSDSSLSLDIEEQEMAKRFQELMKARNVPEDAPAILAAPGETKTKDFSALQLVVLPEGIPLDQCLAYVNASGPVPAATASVGRAALTATVTVHKVEVPEDLSRAVVALQQEARQRVGTAEEQWEAIRQKTRAVLLEARMADVALEVTSEVYQLAPASWKAFVERVMALDGQIAALKLTALAQWQVSEEDWERRMDTIQKSLIDIKTVLANKENEFAAKMHELMGKKAELTPLVNKVAGLKTKLQQEQQTLADAQDALDAELADVATRTEAIKTATARQTAARQELIDQTKKLKDQTLELETRAQELNIKTKELQEQTQTLAARKQAEQRQQVADQERLQDLEATIRQANQVVALRRGELAPVRQAPPARPPNKSWWHRLRGR